MVCLSKPYPFKSFKGCLPQISLGPFLNTLSLAFKSLSTEEMENFPRKIFYAETSMKMLQLKAFSCTIRPQIQSVKQVKNV